ncbi:MAG: hypothetical protein J6M06_01865, partial [Synergistaceae bacterium]|nr:hypothetical protein [Synergistaceae bacterium]
ELLGGTDSVGLANERFLLAQAKKLGKKIKEIPWGMTPDTYKIGDSPETYPDTDDDVIVIVYGYGGDEILIHDIPENIELLQYLESLSSYPVLDERTLAEVESEKRDEAWEFWLREDIRKNLDDLGLLDDFDAAVEDSDDRLQQMFKNSEYSWFDYENELPDRKLYEEIVEQIEKLLSKQEICHPADNAI